MGKAVDKLVRLSGPVRVQTHKRTSKKGKVFDVQSYLRDPGKIIVSEIRDELQTLTGKTDSQSRNRSAALVSELRQRDGVKASSLTPPLIHGEFEDNQNNPLPPLTDAEYEAHVARVDAIINNPKLREYHDTQVLYGVKGADGKYHGAYTPDRERLHNEILDSILKDHKDVPRDRQALMSGGLGGSGKGTVLSSEEGGVDQSKYLTIDPDRMKEELLSRGAVPLAPGLMPMEHAGFIHEESSDLAKKLQVRAMEQGMNIILDTTMAAKTPGPDGDAARGARAKALELKDNGYTVDAVFVDVPLETSIQSALGRHRGGVDRYRAGKSRLGGRYVPIDYIKASASTSGGWSKNREVFDTLVDEGIFENARLFDNSDRTPDPVTGGRRPAKLTRTQRRSDRVNLSAYGPASRRLLTPVNQAANLHLEGVQSK